MEDGIIELDTERAKPFGFTSSLYGEGSYIWKKDGYIMVSFIESLKKGNFRLLVNRILAMGLGVKVPTPLAEMKRIVRKCGYRHTVEQCPMMGPVDVWVLDPLLPQQKGRSCS